MKLSKIVLKVFFSTQNFCGQRSAVALKKDGVQIVRLCHCQPNSLIEINFKKIGNFLVTTDMRSFHIY